MHLLDSQPLNETLTALLTQRSKTLQSILTWTSENGTPIDKFSHNSNGDATQRKSQAAVTSVPVREMTQVVRKALNIISQSVCTARNIFQHEASEPSLIGRVLKSIQTDFSKTDKSSQKLPEELYLSTESLLANLTSSANFQLLPSTIRSYKPYVDSTSSLAFLTQPQCSQKVQTWFQQSSNLWQTCAGGWLTGLQTVKEVWNLRSSIRRWIMSSGLKEEEIIHLLSITDSLCHERIVRIWTQALTGAEALFKSRLRSYVCESQLGTSHIILGNSLVLLTHTLRRFSAGLFVPIPISAYSLSNYQVFCGHALPEISVDSKATITWSFSTARRRIVCPRTLCADDPTRLLDRESRQWERRENQVCSHFHEP